MLMSPLLRDAVEVLIAVALGGMLWSALVRWRRRAITVERCAGCDRPRSRAYDRCPACGAERPPT